MSYTANISTTIESKDVPFLKKIEKGLRNHRDYEKNSLGNK